jgi:hypothetical protein
MQSPVHHILCLFVHHRRNHSNQHAQPLVVDCTNLVVDRQHPLGHLGGKASQRGYPVVLGALVSSDEADEEKVFSDITLKIDNDGMT